MRFYRVSANFPNSYEVKWFGSEAEARKHKKLMKEVRGATETAMSAVDTATDKKSLLEFFNERCA